jgi:abortive infection bacteriophage resistance protein
LKTYNKEPLRFEQQLALLVERGLIVENYDKAIRFLSRVNYYRFSAYCIPFEKSRHSFRENVTFSNVQELYKFDKDLRNLLDEALEIIEIGLKTSIAYHLAHKHNTFIHETPDAFFENRAFTFSKWQEKLHTEIRRSQEKFIDHFKSKYEGFPKLPLWMAVEVMSFGSLSRMISALKRTEQIEIARIYGLHSKVFCSWLHTLVYVRNICAHHGRIWDRVLSIKMAVPKKKEWSNIDKENITSVIYVILHLLSKMQIEKEQLHNWTNKYLDLASRPIPHLSRNLKLKKLADIRQDDLWKKYST